jgi:HSP20 family molecular chaperone IbpA
MKRVYVVLFFLLGLIFWAGAILGQHVLKSEDDKKRDPFEKRLQMREEIHRRMMDKLLKGIGPDQDMFSDMEKMMDEVMSESISTFDSLGTAMNATHFEMVWSENSSGRTLTIDPKGAGQELDINVSNGLISIKGKRESKTPNGVSYSNFTNTFSVPDDCEDTNVKTEEKEGKILILFPFKSSSPKNLKKQDQRRPIGPQDGDVQI